MRSYVRPERRVSLQHPAGASNDLEINLNFDAKLMNCLGFNIWYDIAPDDSKIVV